MKRITFALVIGLGMALVACSFAFSRIIDNSGYADIPVSADDDGRVIHGTVNESAGKSQTSFGFTTFTRDFSRSYRYQKYNGKVSCHFCVEYPNEKFPHSSGIKRWLVGYANNIKYWDDEVMNISPYVGSPDNVLALARNFANRFFDYTDQDYSDDVFEYDMLVCERNERYITYKQNTYCYLGGAHGFNTERFASFDLITGNGITTHYLFKTECVQDVREELIKTAYADERFCEWNDIETMDDVVRCFMPETMTIENIIASFDSTYVQPNVRVERVDISRVGLTRSGVAFSYYPYELSCFAAGCFHFTIPYSKLRKYMTDEAKRCIGE